MSVLTQLDFTTDEDFAKAKRIASAQGYRDSTAYITSSDLKGMYCIPIRRGQPEKTICKTKEFGFIVVQVIED